MKIEFLTPYQTISHRDEVLLDQAFQLRHRIFNLEEEWDLPHVNGRETDRYDSLAYHMLATRNDQTVGYWRLCPTTGPYLTADAFGSLFLDSQPPSAPDVWELSRFSIDNDALGRSISARGHVVASMSAALHEFAVLNGIATFLSVQTDHITKAARLFLGDPTWHSARRQMGKTEACCYAYTLTLEKLYGLRARYHVPAPVLSQLVRAAA